MIMERDSLNLLRYAKVGDRLNIDGVMVIVKETTPNRSCGSCAFKHIRSKAHKQGLQCPAIHTCVQQFRPDRESVYYKLVDKERTKWAVE